VQVAGNDTKLITGMGFDIVEFSSPTLDATAMTHLHLDVWSPTAGDFKVKLVDYGANGVWNAPGTGDDTEFELTRTVWAGGWISFDLPLSAFTGLAARDHLAQLILSTTGTQVPTAWIDNVYFH